MYNVTGSYAKFGKEQMFAVGFISSGISMLVLFTVQQGRKVEMALSLRLRR